MSAYRARRFDESAKRFDAASVEGTRPATSRLFAARSYRAAGSCVMALPRFRQILASYPGSDEAPLAALEGGECARELGDVSLARALFERARAYPSTKASAERALATLPPAQAPPAAAKPRSNSEMP